MNTLRGIKNILLNNLVVFIFYMLSFSTFERLKEISDIATFSFNLQMIIVYIYILKFPSHLGYGHIFFAGIIKDVVSGLPLGTSSLSYLVLCLSTSYIRNATLRPKMTAEWIAFIPALFFSNALFYIIITNFSHLSFYYTELLQNTFFTFLFFPFFYFIIINYQKNFIKDNA